MNIKENCKILKFIIYIKNYEEEGLKPHKQTKRCWNFSRWATRKKEINQRKDNGIKSD